MVSMGGLGHQAPANVVFRSEGNPIGAHQLAQWQGSTAYQDPIYHAPPETRLHAHKAVFGSQQVKDDPAGPAEDSGGVEPADSGADAAPAPEPAAFDFGAESFNYEAL